MLDNFLHHYYSVEGLMLILSIIFFLSQKNSVPKEYACMNTET